jgi:hypothetical protein
MDREKLYRWYSYTPRGSNTIGIFIGNRDSRRKKYDPAKKGFASPHHITE